MTFWALDAERRPSAKPPAIDGPLEFLERYSCVYQGRRFGHVVYRHRGALTSLLVTDGTAPAAPDLEPNDGGPAVAWMPAGRFPGSVVAGLDRREVLRLAQALAEPLSQHLACFGPPLAECADYDSGVPYAESLLGYGRRGSATLTDVPFRTVSMFTRRLALG